MSASFGTALARKLRDLLRELQFAPGTTAQGRQDLFRTIAASMIQGDPTQAQILPGFFPQEVEEAIQSGLELASALNQEGKFLRVETEDLPLATPAAQAVERPSDTFGPFIDPTGRLIRFTAFE